MNLEEDRDGHHIGVMANELALPPGFKPPAEDAGIGFFDPKRHLDVRHHFVGGVYTKEMRIPPDVWLGTHRHSFDHLSVLASGRAIVEVDGERTEYVAPAVITIKAKKFHTIIACEPSVWLCIHRTDCTDPDDIDEELIDRAPMPKEV